LIEGPLYVELSEEDIRRRHAARPENRIAWGFVEGTLNPHYSHDERSLSHLCKNAGVSRFKVFERDWGGRAAEPFLRLDRPSR
jgi:hypothetical protein